MNIIGIDPGVNTGWARIIYAELAACDSRPIHKAMSEVEALHRLCLLKLVVFEDARLRGGDDPKRAQGAGSVKRDSRIWADFLADLGCPTMAVKPQKGGTKWDAETCGLPPWRRSLFMAPSHSQQPEAWSMSQRLHRACRVPM